jgi:hypothetical protein
MADAFNSVGISRSGADAEEVFAALTGASKAPAAALGDAVLDGHYVEVKKASSTTLNQVRAVKYITLVAYSSTEERWYVVPASEVVRQCTLKRRGQHTENPFESSTLSLRNLAAHAVAEPAGLRGAVVAAIEEAQRYPALKELMDRVLAESKALAERSIADVGAALRDYGLA